MSVWFNLEWRLLVVVGGIILLLFTNNPRATDCLLEILPTFSHSPQSLIIYDNLAQNFSNTPTLRSEFCQIPAWENTASPALTRLG